MTDQEHYKKLKKDLLGKLVRCTNPSLSFGDSVGLVTKVEWVEHDIGAGVRIWSSWPGGWIDAGFFIFDPRVFNFIEGDDTYLEKEPLEDLTHKEQLMAYKHKGFWKPMDTLRDKNKLEEYWQIGNAPWKVWKNQSRS